MTCVTGCPQLLDLAGRSTWFVGNMWVFRQHVAAQ
jgi:hypothetical protein